MIFAASLAMGFARNAPDKGDSSSSRRGRARLFDVQVATRVDAEFEMSSQSWTIEDAILRLKFDQG